MSDLNAPVDELHELSAIAIDWIRETIADLKAAAAKWEPRPCPPRGGELNVPYPWRSLVEADPEVWGQDIVNWRAVARDVLDYGVREGIIPGQPRGPGGVR